jgi:hypothetical protein
MNANLISPFKPASNLEYFLFATICFYVGFHGYVNYLYYPNELRVGDFDSVYLARPLDDLLQGKFFFKDFNNYYGPLFSFFQVPFYYFFGSNHWALLVNMYIVMPLLSLVLAYLYIRVFIGISWLRIIFILVCLLHLTVGQYVSPRPLCAELTLALFFFCLVQPEKKVWIFLTGTMQGASILMGTEYGIALFITLIGAFIFFTIFNKKTCAKNLAMFFLLGLLTSLTPFLLYLIYQRILFDFIIDYYILVTTFLAQGPPGRSDFFPPFPSISLSNLSDSIIQTLFSMAFIQYLPIITYGLGGIFFLVRFFYKQSSAYFKYFLLSFFGLLIFYRNWTMPNYGEYGIVPAITLVFLLLETLWLRTTHHYNNYDFQTGYKLKDFLGYCLCSIILSFTFIWFFLSSRNEILFTFNPGKPKSTEMIYYDKVGFNISREAYDQYKAINKYITDNVKPEEHILSFPWGYYSQFTGRANALSSADVAHGVATERQIKIALNQLEERKPKLLILNHLNGHMLIGPVRFDTLTQTSLRIENSPVFPGHARPIQIYILENYHITKRFKLASIMERNEKRKPFNQTFKIKPIDSSNLKEVFFKGVKPINDNFNFKVKGRKIRIEYVLKEAQYTTHLKLKFLINQVSYKKLLTKSHLRLGIIDSRGQNKILGGPNTNDIADLGQVKTKIEATYVPLKEFLEKVITVWIELETPEPYMLPEELQIVSFKLLFDERIKLD